ncbi:MAG TPA: hypothetical protein GXZ61_00285 [Clostridiales bacterium]|jgi:hypothetical protein|nr:hypothetical protein [Clostridiales bacterium]
MKALHYIALSPDDTVQSNEIDKALWYKANESRLNQNFTSIFKQLEELEELLSQLQASLNRE